MLTTNSTESNSTVDSIDKNLDNNLIKLVNQTHLNNTRSIINTEMKLIRSKRQCRNNRRHNRRWPTNVNNRRNRSNRRSHYDHFKETPTDEDRDWELVDRRRIRS